MNFTEYNVGDKLTVQAEKAELWMSDYGTMTVQVVHKTGYAKEMAHNQILELTCEDGRKQVMSGYWFDPLVEPIFKKQDSETQS